jgi:ABC-3C biological conflict system middle component
MMGERAIDVYALTNPAFWALALTQFVAGHREARGDYAPTTCAYPLLFLPMPLVFSREALSRFEGTNRKSGLLAWLERNPSVRATAAPEILAAKPYTRSALTFALAHDLLATPDGWHYSRSAARGWKEPAWPIKTDPRGGLLQASNRLGQWCGALDVPTVFIALGVRP